MTHDAPTVSLDVLPHPRHAVPRVGPRHALPARRRTITEIVLTVFVVSGMAVVACLTAVLLLLFVVST